MTYGQILVDSDVMYIHRHIARLVLYCVPNLTWWFIVQFTTSRCRIMTLLNSMPLAKRALSLGNVLELHCCRWGTVDRFVRVVVMQQHRP